LDVRLQTEPFEPGALLTGFCLGRSETGAVVSLTGLMRAEQGEAEVLELDAYPGFTEVEIGKAVAAAVARFALQDVLVVHRHGAVAPGEPIVFVATAAAHRRAAFEAADHLMDYLKSRAPFWKRSRGPSGDRWIEPTAQDHQDAARWDAPAAPQPPKETP
jgi:molybdopterin synthase catalytic subunit